jgi:hypothetical protein
MESQSNPSQANHNEIAKCAYLLWEQDGCPAGRDQEYWFKAQALVNPAKKVVIQAQSALSKTVASSQLISAACPAVTPATPAVPQAAKPAAIASVVQPRGASLPKGKKRTKNSQASLN